MKRILAPLAILALALTTTTAATAQQPQEAEILPVAETSVSASQDAILPAWDAPTVSTTAATEPQPQETTQPVSETVSEPQPELSYTAPVATEVPTVEAPATVEDPATVPATVEAPATTEPQQEITPEDDPRWDCALMGNRICGLEEAYALSGLTDRGTFANTYVTLAPVGPVADGYRAVRSVINPTYQYVFVKTQAEICSSLELGDAWAGVGTFCQIGKQQPEPAPNVAKPETVVTTEPAAAAN